MAFRIVLNDFSRAKVRALLLVRHYNADVFVKPVRGGWEVSCPAVPDDIPRKSQMGDYIYDDSAWCDDQFRRDEESRSEEFSSDQDDWQRSEDEGWFYGDD